ncbi:fumarylacetoacetate hydrolase family protein [Coraliomargarita sp. SDUM461004]|uniref:Fumarylacetoacetate hydrolase family protein n=1 Tax=Thalassobacterium sedimentorum TaxID=3041258 RepID=A0ABU1AKP9_9BACT|nr:fumarylacetoacetate hydrolase family protein [Coraliomargarita sp. SDUM461004]MDQ8195387.1 fumarylacetoacetate hydrolase family protein [Coraliomargarita sp. SDUM461004]
MNIVRVQTRDGLICYGCEVGDEVFRLQGDLYGSFSEGAELLQPVRRLAPVVPSAIYAIGLNYREHAVEMKAKLPEYPVVFMKSTSSVLDPDCPIILPRHLHSDKVDYECELAVVIGRTCKNVAAENALDYVLGYTCANDVSARDWQKDYGGGQWVKGKSFDTFCPLGPVLVTADRIPNPQILPIRTILNGAIRQESYTGDMIFSVAELIAFLSGSTTLLPGTVILTGTPPGVGVAADPQCFLKPGDDVAIEISGIGTLRNPVVAEVS